jgi:hypothetical protein
MSSAPDGRQIVPAGEQPAPWYRHLLPIAKFLIEERGHLPLEGPKKYGFHMADGGYECHLTRSISQADWEAINELFVIPENVGYHAGLIRDGINRIDMLGTDTCIGDHGIEPIENLEAEIRERDAKLDPPALQAIHLPTRVDPPELPQRKPCESRAPNPRTVPESPGRVQVGGALGRRGSRISPTGGRMTPEARGHESADRMADGVPVMSSNSRERP